MVVAVARVAEGRRRRRRRGERGRGTGGVSDRLVHVALRLAHASAAPPPAAPPSNAHLRSPTLSRAQPLVTRPPAAHPPTGTGAGGVWRRQTRSVYWWHGEGRAMGGSAVCGGARRRGRRRGRRRCPRRGPSGPRAVRRGTGRGTLDGAREPGQTGASRGRRGTGQRRTSRPRPRGNLRGGTAKEFLPRSRSASRGRSPPPDWLPPNGLGAAPAHHASGAPRGAVGEPSLASGKTVLFILHSFIHILFLIPVNNAP